MSCWLRKQLGLGVHRQKKMSCAYNKKKNEKQILIIFNSDMGSNSGSHPHSAAPILLGWPGHLFDMVGENMVSLKEHRQWQTVCKLGNLSILSDQSQQRACLVPGILYCHHCVSTWLFSSQSVLNWISHLPVFSLNCWPRLKTTVQRNRKYYYSHGQKKAVHAFCQITQNIFCFCVIWQEVSPFLTITTVTCIGTRTVDGCLKPAGGNGCRGSSRRRGRSRN